MSACKWRIETVADYEYWQTECDNAFQFNDGDLAYNNFIYCPYCGGKIQVKATKKGAKAK
jgi:DNA-directed RNA polymerase subunit RPC12/RpoP